MRLSQSGFGLMEYKREFHAFFKLTKLFQVCSSCRSEMTGIQQQLAMVSDKQVVHIFSYCLKIMLE